MNANRQIAVFGRVAAMAAMAGVAALAVAAVAPAPVDAQLLGGDEDRRLSVVLGLGYELGGPGDAIMDAMREMGLDGTRPETCVINICEPAREHPWISRGGLNITFLLGAEYDLAGPLYLEGMFSNGVKGNAHGYDTALEAIDVAFVPFLLSGTVGYDLGRFRVAAGPAGLFTMWDVTDRSEGMTEESSTITPGGVVEGVFKTSYRGSLVSFRARYRMFADAEIVAPDPSQTLSAGYGGLVLGVTITVAP